MDVVDNAAGLLERAPIRAGLAPARVSRTPIRRGHALILVATLPIVGRCADFAFACPVGGHHDHDIAEFPALTPNSNYPPCPWALPTRALCADWRLLSRRRITAGRTHLR